MTDPLMEFGGRTRTRTLDPLIKSQLLYQLSYAPGSPLRELPEAASCNKVRRGCPAKPHENLRKSRRANPAASWQTRIVGGLRPIRVAA